MGVVGRLAPTPSGQLHLGNVLAFAAAWLSVRRASGQLLLRIENLDTTRSRLSIERDQRRALEWLGLWWDRETPRQSERDYQDALSALAPDTYRCPCTRKTIAASGGHPRSCRTRGQQLGSVRFVVPEGTVRIVDRRVGTVGIDPSRFDDPVLQRADGSITYPLAVVADDIRDGVTEVVRGADLLDYTAVQVHLWHALGGTLPTWMHGPLLVGPTGNKLSKSDRATHLDQLRAVGWEPAHIWQLLLPLLGCPPAERLCDAVLAFNPTAGPKGPLTVTSDQACPTPNQGFRIRGYSGESPKSIPTHRAV